MEVANPIFPTEVLLVASRLYATTRHLYTHVARYLRQLGIAQLSTPTVV